MFFGCLSAQETLSSELSLEEYMGYVKKHHPIVKQANLLISSSEAKLLKARGAFDPKIGADFSRKKFKNTLYYDKFNAVFKIPTWFGIELKAAFEDNEGLYLNPELNVPEHGLYSAGISVPLAKNLLTNKRMAMLKQAKLYKKQTIADNKLQVNAIVYKAVLTYFEWIRNYKEKQVYEHFLSNAELRHIAVKKSFTAGDKSAIDTTEARINLNKRKLNLEKAALNFRKSSLVLSNFLWVNSTPIEIRKVLVPDINVLVTIDDVLKIVFFEENDITSHPKLQSLAVKHKILEVEQRLKRNNLLPRIDLQYNFVSKTGSALNAFSANDYKAGVQLSFPLFLRKERADLKLVNYKLQSVKFDQLNTNLGIKNKIASVKQELLSYAKQNRLTNMVVSDYELLLKAEQRKFELGESSLFLVNYRESEFIKNKLKAIVLENSLLNAKAKLFNVLGL